MPREILHWDVLSAAANELEPGPIYNVLCSFQAAAFLGAVAHDAPYYTCFGQDRPMEMVAESLHGSNREDTFDPIRKLAAVVVNSTDKREQKMLWAFILGMVSHQVVDVHFHPLVYYLTGDYYHPNPRERSRAQARHRLFEVYLDCWVRQGLSFWNDFIISRVIVALGLDFTVICNLLEGKLVPEFMASIGKDLPHAYVKRDRWRVSFMYLAKLQRLFFSRTGGAIVRALDLLSFGYLDPADHLFSFGREQPQPIFSKAISYQNPTTGELRTESVAELRLRAIAQLKAKWVRFLPLIAGETRDVRQTLGDIQGESLNVGIYQVDSSSYRYFSPTGFDLPGLLLK